MIDFTKMEYVLAFWFASGKEGDWLCFVFRDQGQTDWTLKYRFRYYVDGEAFDSADRKGWYEAKADPSKTTEAELLANIDMIAKLTAQRFGGGLDRVIVRGEPAKAMRLLTERPWAHLKTEELP